MAIYNNFITISYYYHNHYY